MLEHVFAECVPVFQFRQFGLQQVKQFAQVWRSIKFRRPFIGNENVEFLLDEIERAMRQLTQHGNPTIVFTHFALSGSKQIRRK